MCITLQIIYKLRMAVYEYITLLTNRLAGDHFENTRKLYLPFGTYSRYYKGQMETNYYVAAWQRYSDSGTA